MKGFSLFRKQDPRVIPALGALREEFPACGRLIGDMKLYALIGKDRRKLGMDYVERTRAMCKRQESIFAGIAKITSDEPGTMNPTLPDPPNSGD